MTGSLVIRLNGAAGEKARWVLLDASGQPTGQVRQGGLELAAAESAGRRVVLLVPAVDVILARIQVPMRSAPRVIKAAPFALEEQIAEDVDEMHFAVGRQLPGGEWPVAAVREDRLVEWLERLDAAGLEPSAVVSEAVCLPETPGTACWFVDGEQVIARGSDGLDTVSFEVPSLQDLVEFGPDPEDDDAALHVTLYATGADLDARDGEIARLRDTVSSVELRQMDGDPLAYLAPRAVERGALNLLQGDYAPKSSVEVLWKPWRSAAALFGALCVVIIGREALLLADLKGRENELDTAIQAACTQALGGERCVRPVFQVENRLAERLGGGNADAGLFLEGLERLSAALSATSGATLEAVSYRNGVMDLRLKAPSVDSLDKIRSQVSSDQLAASIQSANNEGSFVEGRLQLKRPAG
jgi:general secretion pathway protein L